MTPGKGILKSLSLLSWGYIKERFTKEKISSIGGSVVFLLCVAGYIDNQQAQAIEEVLTLFGYDLNLYGAGLGIISLLAPISKLK